MDRDFAEGNPVRQNTLVTECRSSRISVHVATTTRQGELFTPQYLTKRFFCSLKDKIRYLLIESRQASLAMSYGFKIIEVGTDRIKDRALPPGRNHAGGIIKEECITVFQKRAE